MSTALYRRCRPETFDEVIGQEHVTDPLKAAIERGRINHAYLFSGPRGCGKTTSARILARCLNCEKGPTPVPCGECPSCRDLANGGPGSLDVVEIDAASHNGVDDARDLRERAVYAPARDRFKVFILDEAHMVTSQGFNALLKIVEEPPPHIKFVFATTEPEKVIGTIRSRTHHYPFRLVPPEALGNYLDELCRRENVQVAKGVLPLVVRAGGGSVRDTLSVLDQLIAGSGPNGVDYATAIALLGYTPDSLLSDIVDAFSAGDGAGVYRAVDRVIESGQDPRRFVEDLLERMRDLIVIHAAPEAAHAFLPEVPPDRLERLTLQARGFGQAELSRAADLLNQGLTEMSGATSPRLQLELICARILLPASGRSRDAVLSRVERMERRIGMSATGVAATVPPAAPGPAEVSGDSRRAPGASGAAGGAAPRGPQDSDAGGSGTRQDPAQPPAGQATAQDSPPRSTSSRLGGPSTDDIDELTAMAAAAESMLQEPQQPAQGQRPPQGKRPAQGGQSQQPRQDQRPEDTPTQSSQPRPQSEPSRQWQDQGPGDVPPQRSEPVRQSQEPPRQRQEAPQPAARTGDAGQGTGQPGSPQPASRPEPAGESAPAGPGDGIGGEIEAIRRAWPSILAAVEKRSRLTRAIIAANAIPQSFAHGVLFLGFNNSGSVQGFQQRDHAAKLSMAINDVLGIQARIDIGDVGKLPGGTGLGDAGGDHPVSPGGGAPGQAPDDFTGHRGPGNSHRRPSPQEVAAVVGPREVDKPQVDHERFWETNDSAQGPWSTDDEEGEPSGEPAPTAPATDQQTRADEPGEEPDIVVPDLSDDDFAMPSGAAATAAPAAGAPGIGASANTVVSTSAPEIDASTPPESTSAPATAAEPEPPMEYAPPRWEEPVWHDGPPPAASDPTSAGTGAVEVDALVVPPPEDDDLDYLGAYGDPNADFGTEAGGPTGPGEAVGRAQSGSSAAGPQSSGTGKPFTSRFAAIAQRYGADAPVSPVQSFGGGPSSPTALATAGGGQPQSTGSDEDEYDPETDLDVSEAPQIGVAVIARVLGGEIIDEREV